MMTWLHPLSLHFILQTLRFLFSSCKRKPHGHELHSAARNDGRQLSRIEQGPLTVYWIQHADCTKKPRKQTCLFPKLSLRLAFFFWWGQTSRLSMEMRGVWHVHSSTHEQLHYRLRRRCPPCQPCPLGYFGCSHYLTVPLPILRNVK